MLLLRASLLALLLMVGCHKPENSVLGKNPVGAPTPILALRQSSNQSQVTIQGRMIEKCPVAGCWLRVKDSTGSIKVDTKSAGFVVVEVPLKQQVTVSGTLVMEGDERTLQADGLRY